MADLRKTYEKFCEQGESGRANVNELLKAIVEALAPNAPKGK